jgi:hypothetical protein
MTDPYPIFDTLDRLYREGWTIEQRCGLFFLFDNYRNKQASGDSFRDLCVNIVLMGL